MNTINYEVRDSFDQAAGWFAFDFDANTFVLAQMKPENYTVHEVNKILKEND